MRTSQIGGDNWRRPKSNSAVAAFGVGAPPKPRGLSKEASKAWDYHAPLLVAANVLSPLDLGSFAMYCEVCGEIAELRAHISEHGEFVSGKHGERLSAQGRQLHRLRGMLLIVARQFGLTPASRATMKTSTPQTAENDPLLIMFQKRAERKNEN